MHHILFEIGIVTIIKVKMKLLRHFLDEALKKSQYGERFYVVQKTEDGLGYVVAIKAMDQRHFENEDDMAYEWELLIDYNKFKTARRPKVATKYRSNFFSALHQKSVFPGGKIQSLNKERVLTEYEIHPKDHYRYFSFSWVDLKFIPKWPIGLEDVDHSTPTSSLDQNNQIIELPGFGKITLHYDLQSNSLFILQEATNSTLRYDLQSNSSFTLHEATNSTEHVTENSSESLEKMEIGEPLPLTFEGEGGSVDSSTPSEMDDYPWTEETSPQRSSSVKNKRRWDQDSDVSTESGTILSSADEGYLSRTSFSDLEEDNLRTVGTNLQSFLAMGNDVELDQNYDVSTESGTFGLPETSRRSFKNSPVAQQDTPENNNVKSKSDDSVDLVLRAEVEKIKKSPVNDYHAQALIDELFQKK